MYHPLLQLIYFYDFELIQTFNAIDDLFERGCTSESLKPYSEHADYLNERIKMAWSEFLTSIEQDAVRKDMCSHIIWRPVTGIEYKKIISDPEFKSRWKL